LGIAERAARDKTCRFRSLARLLTEHFLTWCWSFLNKKAASGVDKVSAKDYEVNLQTNVENVVTRIKGKRYRAKLVKRQYIPKSNGELRPLGIPAIDDKLLQTGVKVILEAIYEQDSLYCRYGYRPNIRSIDAVKNLSGALTRGKLNYIVEADIKGYFDNIDHCILLDMVSLRVDDRVFLGLIRKWLKAGILDTDGNVIQPVT